MRRSRVALFSVGVLAAGALAVAPATSGHADVTDLVKIPGLHAPASVVRDDDGIAHIKAKNAHDLFFLQGWVHADDRLFQMDVRRRTGSGTLAELLGSSALPSDVQLRTFGLRRTVERSLSVLSSETQADLARVRRRGERVDRPQQAAVAVRGGAGDQGRAVDRGGQPAREQVARVQPVVRPGHRPDHGRAEVQRGRSRRAHRGVPGRVPVRAVQHRVAGDRLHRDSGQPGHAEPGVQRQHRRVG